MTDVVVIGSLNVDFVVAVPRLPQPGETVAGLSAERAAGGKGANQAVAAARLAAGRVWLAGLVGDDDFGAQMCSTLAAQGVDVTHVHVLKGSSTGIAFITVQAGGENMITVAAGANGGFTPDVLGGVAGLRALLARADALLLQLEIPIATCVAAAEVARSLGVMVVLNAAPTPASESPELARLLRLTDIVIVNETEAELLIGQTSLQREAGQSYPADPSVLRSLGPAVAVITLGRRGACADDGTGRVDQPGFDVPSVDAVGAGDAFCAQFALAYAAKTPLRDALRRACAAAALATTAPGAQSAVPAPADVDRLLTR